jgi:tRNA threonylcarbamoyladenosine biosynthesis protein TsaE
MQHLADSAATVAWGIEYASTLNPGSVIALVGSLGAGKTHVTKGIVQGLGGQTEVTSPTFTLVHEYRDATPLVFHFDLYRLDSEADLLRLGWDEMLDEPAVIIVEWADLFPQLLPSYTQWWKLTTLPEGGRSIERIIL